uniref:Threonine dehydratase n=1 Tax=Compsopogon caeruleus TaxID=31354 RepID=A0A7S1TBW2_9RHOD|mmetsp:Transcript_16719/g.34415  ORF Transcript_16719/g.34415 Transcript_16719/m.34415 type:complete len:574 (+) Transcript_16719:2760-4481(+)
MGLGFVWSVGVGRKVRRQSRCGQIAVRCCLSASSASVRDEQLEAFGWSSEGENGVYCYIACSPTRNDYLEQVLTSRVYDVAVESPLEEAVQLSSRMRNTLWLKREDMQPVFSFKLRGAYNMMAKADQEVITRTGVVCASAGNHAQGVALGAQRLGVEATIVMPEPTPMIKVDAVRRRGAQILLHGVNFDEAKRKALEIADRTGALFIPPFDHPDVIAGQGTIGLELLRQCSGRKIDSIFVPVGGGGLIAGIATVIKRLRPEVKVIGVESTEADALFQSLKAGERVKLPAVGTFADGVAVIEVGEETFRICRQLVDEVIVVDNDEICAAIKDVFEETRSILEPAGALSIAGAKAYVDREKCTGRNLVAIASGANMNFDRLRHVSERAELGEGREAVLAVRIPEKPGAFKALIAALKGLSVTEFNYRFSGSQDAQVFIGIAVRGRIEIASIRETLCIAGYDDVEDLSENELAKLHVRHLVGGVGPTSLRDAERVYRVEFPERPGALLNFLLQMKFEWNITLFHYRNHGTDVGRVLVGIDVPDNDISAFNEFLNGVGYPFIEETENPAYQRFLRNK